MNSVLCVAFAILGVFVGAEEHEHLLGGLEPLPDNANSPIIDKGYDLIKTYLLKNQAEINDGYTTTLSFSNKKISKQVVAGSLYVYNLKTTFNYECDQTKKASHPCQEKAPVTKTCTASVWQKPQVDAPLEFAPGKEPQCQ